MNEGSKQKSFVLSCKTPLQICKSKLSSRCCLNTNIRLRNVGLKGNCPLKTIWFKMNKEALFHKTYECCLLSIYNAIYNAVK